MIARTPGTPDPTTQRRRGGAGGARPTPPHLPRVPAYLYRVMKLVLVEALRNAVTPPGRAAEPRGAAAPERECRPGCVLGRRRRRRRRRLHPRLRRRSRCPVPTTRSCPDGWSEHEVLAPAGPRRDGTGHRASVRHLQARPGPRLGLGRRLWASTTAARPTSALRSALLRPPRAPHVQSRTPLSSRTELLPAAAHPQPAPPHPATRGRDGKGKGEGEGGSGPPATSACFRPTVALPVLPVHRRHHL